MAEILGSVTTPSQRDYSLADLQKLTGYSGRAIARYIAMGLVPRPKQAGSRTRYSREALGRLLAIAKLRREDKKGTPTVDYVLRDLTDEEVEAYAEAGDPLRSTVATAPVPLPQTAVRENDLQTPALVPSPSVAATPLLPACPTQRWLRISLIPGLELMVHEGGGDLVARLAREIVARYGTNLAS